ncbi:MAG: acyltransferase family protein [Prevotella sp.]|nr:acyltransferase family protein [Candidatus Prevotella equi]
MDRILGIDAVAGIMIINMILGHFGSKPEWAPLDYLCIFMPWFFFKSGMFYKKKGLRDVAMGGAKKLCYPFITFSIVGWCVHSIFMYIQHEHNFVHYFATPIKELLMCGSIQGNLALWFLLSLYFVNILYTFCINKKVNKHVILIFCVIIACILYEAGIIYPYYLANTILGLAFYCAGNMYAKKQYEVKYGIVSLIVSLIIFSCCYSNISFRNNELTSGYYLLACLFAVTGCISINFVFLKIPYNFVLLSWIGRNSMILYVTHWIMIYVYNIIVTLCNYQPTNKALEQTFAYIILSPIIVYIFKKTRFKYLINF